MNTRVFRKAFCRTCGVQITNNVSPLTDEQVAALPDPLRAWRTRMLDTQPLNLRVLNDFDARSLETTKADGYHIVQSPYVNP